MAVLDEANRSLTWRQVMAQMSSARTQLASLSKADLRAAIDGLDSFLDANATAINNAIPQPVRGNLTASLKAMCLVAVITRRWIAGS